MIDWFAAVRQGVILYCRAFFCKLARVNGMCQRRLSAKGVMSRLVGYLKDPCLGKGSVVIRCELLMLSDLSGKVCVPWGMNTRDKSG